MRGLLFLHHDFRKAGFGTPSAALSAVSSPGGLGSPVLWGCSREGETSVSICGVSHVDLTGRNASDICLTSRVCTCTIFLERGRHSRAGVKSGFPVSRQPPPSSLIKLNGKNVKQKTMKGLLNTYVKVNIWKRIFLGGGVDPAFYRLHCCHTDCCGRGRGSGFPFFLFQDVQSKLKESAQGVGDEFMNCKLATRAKVFVHFQL